MDKLAGLITVIVGLAGLATPTEKIFKKIMERVKMGKTEDDRVKAAEKELDAALVAQKAADKAAAVLGKPAAVSDNVVEVNCPHCSKRVEVDVEKFGYQLAKL